MAHIKDFAGLLEEAFSPARTAHIRRMAHLTTYKTGEIQPETYTIKITFEDSLLLTEHEHIQNFKKTNNRYYFHPEEIHPPVEAHYHIIGPKSKAELYSVTVSGKAHHKVNRGHKIPNKRSG